MATTKSILSSDEKQAVLDALDMQAKSFERGEKAAKDLALAAAYRGAAAKVRALHAKLTSLEVEV